MSASLAEKIQLGLDELAVIRGMMAPLIARTGEPELPVIETAAACTMLHSFYTEIEKILKLIALDLDKKIPSSESWHRDLLSQMAAATEARPAVITVWFFHFSVVQRRASRLRPTTRSRIASMTTFWVTQAIRAMRTLDI